MDRMISSRAESPVCRVTKQVQEVLRTSPYSPIRRVACAYDDGLLVLRGSLRTFFHKQLAQEAVARVDGVRQVVNEIEVVQFANWSPVLAPLQENTRMKATLHVFDPQSEEPRVFVAELPVTVGRGHEAEIRLADWWVSRAHCQIDEVDGSLVVRDLGSKHGTLVNRHSIVESRLWPEDELLIGLTSVRVSLDSDADSLLEPSTAWPMTHFTRLW
jgi:hypothetical protein